MSLEHLEIRNYQSLYHVALDLEPFTVIVGQSSSGKSALTRALRMLTSNARGSSFISHGERLTTIRAVTERGTVILKRGKGTDDNEYQIVPSGPDEQPRTFTKLGGAVPDEVSKFLGIEASDPLHYAGQFDSPYLLRETGGAAAKTLGGLTNVNVIFQGAAESNRRKKAAGQTLKTRQSDHDATDEKIPAYRALKSQLAAIAEAEEGVGRAQAIEARIQRLDAAATQAEMAAQALERAEASAAITAPDEQPMLDAVARLQRLNQVITDLQTAASAYKAADAAEDDARHDIEALEHDYAETLRQAATCPTCGQSTKHLQEAHA